VSPKIGNRPQATAESKEQIPHPSGGIRMTISDAGMKTIVKCFFGKVISE
jgi:hypothetical protein